MFAPLYEGKVLNCVMICMLTITVATVPYLLKAQQKPLVNGSLIIALVSNDTVWLGADSRTSALTNKGYTANKTAMCKIHNTNGVVYAMAGHVKYIDNSFNFLRIMDKSINRWNNFDSAMLFFRDKTIKEIPAILKKFSSSSIQTLINKNGGSFLSVLAVTFANGEKKMREMRFSIAGNGRQKWAVTVTEADVADTGTLRFLGHASSALQHISDYPLYFGNGQSMPQKIENLIRIQAANGSATVGLPADVISIYNNGFTRALSSGLCQ